MCGNRCHEIRSKILQLSLAHAVDAGKFLLIHRIVSRHLAQSYVGKDDVWRHSSFVSQFLAEPTQSIEQRFVTDDLARWTKTAREANVEMLD